MAPEGIQAVVIGASAGAVQALLQIFPALPAPYPVPILVIVHIPPGKDNALVPLFASKTPLTVKEAEDKEPPRAGIIYFAPSDYHLLVEDTETLALSGDEPANHSRPSIDVLFESAADIYGPSLVGIILTGANSDGAAGLKAIANAGGHAIIEDPTSASAATMPAAALAACPGADVWHLGKISSFLEQLAVT